VTAIIALLMAVILPAIFSQLRRGRVTRIITESDNIRTASLAYFTDRGRWPRSNEVDGAINELLTHIRIGELYFKGPYLDKGPRKRAPDNRYANHYAGLLMLNDLNDGSGDDSGPDRKSNQSLPDSYVYNGSAPTADAAETDDTLDGALNIATGAVVLFSGDDWTATEDGASDILIIISEGF
jgi:type II secretory pathway pseudopilin PulG